MHEWALAEAIIAAASEISEREKLKEVLEVKVKVGELQQVEIGILEFALSQLKSPRLRSAKFCIETAEAEFKCRVCGHGWAFKEHDLDEYAREAIHFVPEIAHTYIKCPRCGSSDFEILRGRGVWLESVRGMK